MEKRGLFIDCSESDIVWQIKNFFQRNYSDVFPVNLSMMGTIYPFLIENTYNSLLKQIRYARDFETFKDQAVQLINEKKLNMVVVASELDCFRYKQLLENGMIVNYDSQEKAFRVALERFRIFIKNYTDISSDRLFAWHIDHYDKPENIYFREISFLE